MGAHQSGRRPQERAGAVVAGQLVVRVLPDVPAIDREFDYLVDLTHSDEPVVGTMVRVPLHVRRVAGWITAVGVDPPAGVTLQSISKVSGIGPSAEMIELCRWAAWRWAGRMATFVGAASPPSMVRALPAPVTPAPAPAPSDPLASESLGQRRTVLRLPPTYDLFAVVAAATTRGDALVICPSVVMASRLAARMRRAGSPVALLPREWARAAAGGCTVIGARGAAFAPMPHLGSVVVLDEHDEALQNEGSPTWHAREVALERARRARVPAILTSPCPTLEAQQRSPLVTLPRSAEREGWPVVQVVDRRDDDLGRTGLYAEETVRAMRSALDTRRGPVVCVLNRRGRASLLACNACGIITACERCDGAMQARSDGVLRCRRCAAERPVVWQSCGGTKLRKLWIGVTRAREERAALMGQEVVEVSGDVDGGPGAAAVGAEAGSGASSNVMVGTEAVLHRVESASTVVFLEFDQELSTARYRAGEQAMALLARAARLVGPRSAGGQVIVQTRLPEHEVLVAAVRADPSVLSDVERERRQLLDLPPVTTTAQVGGPAGAEFIDRLGAPDGVVVREREGEWLVSARERSVLLDAIAAVRRPPGRLRLQIDPPRA